MWTKTDSEWRRSDGVRVRPNVLNSSLSRYCVLDRIGAPLMQPHGARRSVARSFSTPENAMESADRHWPLKA